MSQHQDPTQPPRAPEGVTQEMIDASMRDYAAKFVEMAGKGRINLDYTLASIEVVDKFLSRNYPDGVPKNLDVVTGNNMTRSLSALVGSYVGEVLVREAGGTWGLGENGAYLTFAETGPSDRFAPIRWANARLQMGKAASLTTFVEKTLERLRTAGGESK